MNLLLATAPAEVPRGDLPAGLPRSPYSQRGEEEKLVHAPSESVRLSNLRYRGGLDSYLAQLRLVELQSVVQLYRALGGGWQ